MSDSPDLIKYSKLEAIASGNHQFLKEITDSFIQLISQFERDYQQTADARNAQSLGELTHRVKGSLRFLEAEQLLRAISRYRSELHAGNVDAQATRESIKEISLICQQILEILKREKTKLG